MTRIRAYAGLGGGGDELARPPRCSSMGRSLEGRAGGAVIVDLDAAQRRNFLEAMAVATSPAERVRLVFAIWTETSGYNHSNDGRNLSESPGVTQSGSSCCDVPLTRNGSGSTACRSIGSAQTGDQPGSCSRYQADVGGGWGDMVGTLRPAVAAQRFLQDSSSQDNEMFKAGSAGG